MTLLADVRNPREATLQQSNESQKLLAKRPSPGSPSLIWQAAENSVVTSFEGAHLQSLP